MNLYQFLVQAYNNFLAVFPPDTQWIITLIIVVGLVGAFIGLIRHNALFIIVLIVLLPVIAPVLQHFFADVYDFFLYLLSQLNHSAPSGQTALPAGR